MASVRALLSFLPFAANFLTPQEETKKYALSNTESEAAKLIKVKEAVESIGGFKRLGTASPSKSLSESHLALFAEIPEPCKPLPPYKRVQPNLVTRFFPDLFHLFYKAFNTSSSTRPQHSLYEVHCIIGVYFFFLKIPYNLALLIAKVTQSVTQAFVATTLFFGISTLALYTYFKYKKGVTRIDYCHRVVVERVPFQLHDYTKALSFKQVVLHGPPGVGKSAYLEGLAAEHTLKGKKVYQIENAWVFGPTTMGLGNAGEKLQAIFDEARKDPENTVIVADEFGDATVGGNGSETFALKGYPELTFLTAMQSEQLETIKKTNPSLLERFHEIRCDRPNTTQILLVLKDIANKEAPHIPITKAALEKIVSCTVSDLPQYRKPVEFLRALIKSIESNRIAIDPPLELNNARQKHQALMMEASLSDNPIADPDSPEFAEYNKKLREAEKTLQTEETNFIRLQNDAKLYVELQTLYRAREYRRNALARQWVQSKNGEEKKVLAAEIDYIHCTELVKLKAALQEIKPLLRNIFFEVDVAAVEQFALLK